jgi:uncharacterized membrane protein
MQGLESAIVAGADTIQLIFEAASVFVVAAGGIAFLFALLTKEKADTVTRPRQVLGRYLIIALELQLAADIIATATQPTLEELGKLAAIALIRTFLNFFLVREMREEKVQS